MTTAVTWWLVRQLYASIAGPSGVVSKLEWCPNIITRCSDIKAKGLAPYCRQPGFVIVLSLSNFQMIMWLWPAGTRSCSQTKVPVYGYIYIFFFSLNTCIHTHTLVYIYTHAHCPTNTKHPKPFNSLLTRFLLTKHVEEFLPSFPPGTQRRPRARRDSGVGWPGSWHGRHSLECHSRQALLIEVTPFTC